MINNTVSLFSSDGDRSPFSEGLELDGYCAHAHQASRQN